MNAKLMVLIGAMAVGIFAQSDQKFKLYGFADMTLTKYFPKENSSIMGVSLMDERFMFSFDHLNLYQEYRPNDKVRFLTEMSYQDKPPTYVNKAGTKFVMMGTETVFAEASLADTNKTVKGIVNYEWGSFSVERAQMSLSLNRYANLTFGKFITPAGIWNVDHGSPVIMTVNQPSQYTFREIYPKSQLGIMENGTYFLGDVDLSYTVYLSSGRGNPVIKRANELAAGGQLRVGLPVLDECNIGISGYTGSQTAVLRNSIMTFDMFFNATTEVIDTRLFKYRENVLGADFKVKKSIVTLQAEFNYQAVMNKMRTHDDSINTSILATYVLGSVDAYKSTKLTVTPYAFYEYVKYKDTYNNPSLFGVPIAEGTPEATQNQYFLGYMKFMAGVNTRIHQNFGVKTEFNFTRLFQAKQPDYSKFPPEPVDPNGVAEDKDGLLDIPGVAAQFYVAF